MKADGRVVIDTALNNKGFTTGVKDLKKDMGGLTAAAGKLAGAMAAAFSVKAVLDFGRACVQVGSDIAEVQNVVDVAFGSMKWKVEEFADSAILNFGMSTLAAKKTASTYMAMARGMGIAEDAASDMAISLAGMTGDVASFYNISQELADIKLKSVFTGETETLKDLGIVMTQANLKQYALSQGITKSLDAMTQSELVMLRYGFVMKSLSLAQGDFIRTQGSWANQTRILSMQWQELMGIIGQGLTTVLLPLVQMLNWIVGGLISVGNAIKSLFGGEAEQAEQTTTAIGGAVDNQNALTGAVKETAKEQKKALAGFDEINKLSAPAKGAGAGAGGAGVPAIMPIAPVNVGASAAAGMDELADKAGKLLHLVTLIGAGLLAWKLGKGLLGKIRVFVGVLFAVKGAIRACKDAMDIWNNGANADNVQSLFQNLFVMVSGLLLAFGPLGAAIGLIAGALVTLGLGFHDALENGWNFQNMALVISGLLMGGLGIFVLTGTWIPMLIGAIAAVVLALAVHTGHGAELIEGFKNVFKGLVDFVAGVFTGDMSKALGGLDKIFAGLGGIVGAVIGGIEDTFMGFLSWLDEKTGGHLGPIIETVKLLFKSMHESISSVIEGVKQVITGLVKFVTGVFSGDWDLAWEGIKDIFKGVWNGMVGIVESALNFFVRGINKFTQWLSEKLRVDVPDWVPGIGGKHFGITIPMMPEVELPRLAKGAVIPPNREFMAVLGDQRNGTNIEAPLETIVQAMQMALGDRGGQNEADLIVDDEILGKLVYRLYNAEARRVGVNLRSRA